MKGLQGSLLNNEAKMNINEFISQYHNHPVLFVGAGISLRYLNNSYTWDGLLKFISFELTNDEEFYLDIKSSCEINGKYDYTAIASKLEKEFNSKLSQDRHGKFKYVNDIFYEEMAKNNNLSRFKIYISKLLENLEYKNGMSDEIAELRKIGKNIGSVITTNYDCFIESIFRFTPLIGNDILLSNPYGSIYKIHGCCSDSSKIIMTEDDYKRFESKYELIRAQLLSLFIHNPIIFIGYNIGDDNIKSLLKTIFTYVPQDTDDAQKIRDNFLLVEYEKDSVSHEIVEHDIDLEGFSTIRINKIKTDDFSELYKSISNLSLPVSAMDIRKVQNIVKDIYAGVKPDGSSIKVQITEDMESLNNMDKILVIGSKKSITYQHRNTSSFIVDYFDIVEQSNKQLISLINDINIPNSQWFPIFGFSKINDDLTKSKEYKLQQISKIEQLIKSSGQSIESENTSISGIMNDEKITKSNKQKAILWSIWHNKIDLDEVEKYLKEFKDKSNTDYRRIICAYDNKKYS